MLHTATRRNSKSFSSTHFDIPRRTVRTCAAGVAAASLRRTRGQWPRSETRPKTIAASPAQQVPLTRRQRSTIRDGGSRWRPAGLFGRPLVRRASRERGRGGRPRSVCFRRRRQTVSVETAASLRLRNGYVAMVTKKSNRTIIVRDGSSWNLVSHMFYLPIILIIFTQVHYYRDVFIFGIKLIKRKYVFVER